MNWLAAVGTGAGLGIVYFGGLWLTVRSLLLRGERGAFAPCLRHQQGADAPRSPGVYMLVSLSRVLRIGLVGAGFYGLAQQGAAAALAGLGGLWLVRGYMVRRLGGWCSDDQRTLP